MTAIRSATTAVVLMASVIARADAPPKWVSGDSPDWPRERYVIGVGSADDRATAEQRARAEIARFFSASVISQTSTSAEERSSAGPSADTASRRYIADFVQTYTEKLLEGSEIAAYWQDGATRQHYALAVLDRARASIRLRGQLSDLDTRSRGLDAEVRSAAAPADAAVPALRLVALRRKWDPVVADLRVLEPSAVTSSEVAQRSQAAQAALSRLKVSAAVSGDGTDALRAAVAKGLAVVGLRAGAAKDGADFTVVARTRTEDLGLIQGWYWSRTYVFATVREVRSGKVLVQLDDSAREAAQIASEARRRSARSAADRLAEAIPDGFMRWAEP